jgi:hypothetical protein
MDKMAGTAVPGVNFYVVSTANLDGTLATETRYSDAGHTIPTFDLTCSDYDGGGRPVTTVKRWYVAGIVPADGKHILTETHSYDAYGNDSPVGVWS